MKAKVLQKGIKTLLMWTLVVVALPNVKIMAQERTLSLPTNAEDVCLIPMPQQLVLTEGSAALPAQGILHVLMLFGDGQYGVGTVDFLTSHGIVVPSASKHYFGTDVKKYRHMESQLQQKEILYVTEEKVDSLPVPQNMDEAYMLEITPQKIAIRATSQTGVLMACYTLIQLRQAYGTRLPCLRITDWPAYTYRGWMDDISRGPIPTAGYMTKEMDILSLYKMNFWNFYTEHTLRNDVYPDVAPGDGLTRDDVAGALGMACAHESTPAKRLQYTVLKPMANLQCFAHAEKTLRIPFYQNMMDTKRNFNPGNEDTYTYLKQTLRFAADTFYRGCEFFNIDCDETEGLGSGRGRDYVSKMGEEEAYCRHIVRVCDILRPYNKKVLMWGDIVAKNPDMIARLPKEIQYIVWNYAPQESYEQALAPFRKAHEEHNAAFWVAPSVAHSSLMLPNADSYMQNIAYLARDGYAAGAAGLMNTAWDDNGEALFDNTWHGMLWAAEMAWKPIKSTDPEQARKEMKARVARFDRNMNVLFFSGEGFAILNSDDDAEYCKRWDPVVPGSEPVVCTRRSVCQGKKTAGLNYKEALCRGCENEADCPIRAAQALQTGSITTMLHRVGALENDPDIAEWFTTASLYEPLYNFYPSKVDTVMDKRIDRALNKLNVLERNIVKISDTSNYGVHNPMKHALYAVHHMQITALKCRLRRQIWLTLQDTSAANRTSCRQMAQDYFRELHALKKEYLRLWDAESRESSRQIVCDRFDALGQEVLDMDRHVFISMQDTVPPAKKSKALSTQENIPMVTLRTLYGDKAIFYTTDGRTPTTGTQRYDGPFPLEHSCLVKTVSYDEYNDGVTTERYMLQHKAIGCPITLATNFSTYRDVYSGGGNNALVDGQLGSDDSYADGHWQGYWGENIDVTVDLRKVTAVNNVSVRFLQNTFDWILAPTELQLYTSADGKTWKQVRSEKFNPEFARNGNVIYTDALHNLSLSTRYLRLVAPNPGPLPAWHPSKGQPSYLFADEIVVE